MKHIFTLMASAAMCLSASAAVDALYIAGPAGTEINGTPLPNWDIVNTVKVEPNRGNFVLEIKNYISAIAVSDKAMESADWGFWNTGLWACSAAAELTEADMGKEFPLEGPGAGNLALPWKGDWTVTISGDLKTVKFNTTTPKPKDTVHLLGDGIIGWSPSDKYAFEQEGSSPYWWLDIPEAEKISGPIGNINIILNNNWESFWGTPGKPMELDKKIQAPWKSNNGESGGTSIPAGSEYWGTILFEMPALGQPANVTFYTTLMPHSSGVTDAITEEAVANDAPAEYFNLQGMRVAQPESGKLYIERRGSKVSKVIMK